MPSTPSDVLYALLAKKQSPNELDAILNLDAPMDYTQPIDWQGSELHAKAMILGNVIWDKTYSSGDVTLTGKLDSLTFHPIALGIKYGDPENPIDLGSQTFFKESAKIPLAPLSLPKGILRVNLTVGLTITGDFKAGAGLLLNWSGKGISWDPTGTYISLNASLDPTVTASIEAQALWLVNVTAIVTMNTHFHLDGQVNFTGPFPGILKVSSSSFIGWLDGDYEFKVHGELFNTVTLFDYDSGDIKIKPVTLFKF